MRKSELELEDSIQDFLDENDLSALDYEGESNTMLAIFLASFGVVLFLSPAAYIIFLIYKVVGELGLPVAVA